MVKNAMRIPCFMFDKFVSKKEIIIQMISLKYLQWNYGVKQESPRPELAF